VGVGGTAYHNEIRAVEDVRIGRSDRHHRDLCAIGQPLGDGLRHLLGASEHRFVDDDCSHDSTSCSHASKSRVLPNFAPRAGPKDPPAASQPPLVPGPTGRGGARRRAQNRRAATGCLPTIVVLALGSHVICRGRALLAAARGAFTPAAGHTARLALRRQPREDPPVCAPVSICRGHRCRAGRDVCAYRLAAPVFRFGVVPLVTVPARGGCLLGDR